MNAILRYGTWAWCALVVPTMIWWLSCRPWLLFLAFTGLALVLLTSQTILGVVQVGGAKRRAPGDSKEEEVRYQ